jgi:hypothetical protein
MCSLFSWQHAISYLFRSQTYQLTLRQAEKNQKPCRFNFFKLIISKLKFMEERICQNSLDSVPISDIKNIPFSARHGHMSTNTAVTFRNFNMLYVTYVWNPISVPFRRSNF